MQDFVANSDKEQVTLMSYKVAAIPWDRAISYAKGDYNVVEIMIEVDIR